MDVKSEQISFRPATEESALAMADPRLSAANGGNGSAPDPRDGTSLQQSIHPADYTHQLQLLGQYGYHPNQWNFKNGDTTAGGRHQR